MLSPLIAQEKGDNTSSTFLSDAPLPEGVINVGLGVTLPRPIFSPNPEYPLVLKGKRKIRGVCVLGLIVDEHGRVHDVHVTRSLDARLDQSAINAVKQWRFKPAKMDGKPVAVFTAVEVSFGLY